MKNNYLAALTLLLAGLLFASCASPGTIASPHPRFREAEAASVVLCHSAWDCIKLTRPEYRRDGYVVPLSPKELGSVFDQLGVKRDLAVVVLDWEISRQNRSQIVADWESILHGHGFSRVVCLEGGRDKQVQGLRIIDDTQSSDETHLRSARR